MQCEFPSRAAPLAGLEKVDYCDDTGMPQLERRLRDDLKHLGYADHSIDHIELGRDCERELVQLGKMGSLRARREAGRDGPKGPGVDA